MVQRPRRGRRRKLLGSHQRCWLWGRRLVEETLRAARWPILELALAEDLPHAELAQAQAAAESLQTPVRVLPSDELRRLAGTNEHQGYLAKMPPYPYSAADEVFERAAGDPLFVVLDRLQDPYNFGAILRTAEALGVDGVFVGERDQAEVTALVARASAGAINHVRLARVDDLPRLAARLRERGLRLAAAVLDDAVDLDRIDLTGPLVVVIGNEGAGIAADLLALCDVRVQIPQQGAVESLNAAVAAGIVLYEVHRQRRLP
ncbi:MAG: 23S rRNA (guanosine(2251)-2'-O)-methyltransferase RlmB [Planctomycetes bacterium]|nr:23S rRNA (guanosine(2251)-2'-O)-methyltransferase RlmB [Planctomycetota bacterium]